MSLCFVQIKLHWSHLQFIKLSEDSLQYKFKTATKILEYLQWPMIIEDFSLEHSWKYNYTELMFYYLQTRHYIEPADVINIQWCYK